MWIASCILFGLVWMMGVFLIVLQVIANVGGWNRLAAVYRHDGPFTGQTWRFRDMVLKRWCNYGGCVTYGVTAEGLYVSPVFRIAHRPVLIPWEDLAISYKERRTWLGTWGWAELVPRQVPNVSLSLSGKLMTELAEAVRPLRATAAPTRVDA
jgi:hypothetical protein